MTALNNSSLDLEQVSIDIETKKAMAAELVTALELGRKDIALQYLPDPRAVDLMAKHVQTNIDTSNKLLGGTYNTTAQPEIALSQDWNDQPDMSKAIDDYTKQGIGIAVMRDYASLSMNSEQQKWVKNYTNREFCKNALNFAHRETLNNATYGIESESLLSQKALRGAALQSQEYAITSHPKKQNIALDTVPHLDRNLSNSAMSLDQNKPQMNNSRWWADPGSKGYNQFKKSLNQALQSDRSEDQDLTRLSYRYDMKDHGMPNGFFKELQDKTQQMQQYVRSGNEQEYVRAQQQLVQLGQQMRKHAIDEQTNTIKNPVIAQSLYDINQHGKKQSPEQGVEALVQRDLAKSLTVGFEKGLNEYHLKIPPIQSPTRETAMSGIQQNMQRNKPKLTDGDGEGDSDMGKPGSSMPGLKPGMIDKSDSEREFMRKWNTSFNSERNSLKAELSALGLTNSFTDQKQSIDDAKNAISSRKRELGINPAFKLDKLGDQNKVAVIRAMSPQQPALKQSPSLSPNIAPSQEQAVEQKPRNPAVEKLQSGLDRAKDFANDMRNRLTQNLKPAEVKPNQEPALATGSMNPKLASRAQLRDLQKLHKQSVADMKPALGKSEDLKIRHDLPTPAPKPSRSMGMRR